VGEHHHASRAVDVLVIARIPDPPALEVDDHESLTDCSQEVKCLGIREPLDEDRGVTSSVRTK
jgi:hypothetical protein